MLYNLNWNPFVEILKWFLRLYFIIGGTRLWPIIYGQSTVPLGGNHFPFFLQTKCSFETCVPSGHVKLGTSPFLHLKVHFPDVQFALTLFSSIWYLVKTSGLHFIETGPDGAFWAVTVFSFVSKTTRWYRGYAISLIVYPLYNYWASNFYLDMSIIEISTKLKMNISGAEFITPRVLNAPHAE